MAIKKKKLLLKKNINKKKPVKKTLKRTQIKKTTGKKSSPKQRSASGVNKEILAGEVTHYFPKLSVAVIKLKALVEKGDKLRIKGHTTDFKQTVNSIQLDHVSLDKAKKGEEIGLLVDSRVRQRDLVYKIELPRVKPSK